jgi:hypothetical protein
MVSDSLQMWRVVANMVNRHSWAANKEWFSISRVE